MPSDASTTEEPFASTSDPYESEPAPTSSRYTKGILPSHIKPENLSSPNFLFRWLTSYNIADRDQTISGRLQHYEKAMSRPLADDEETAIVQNAAQGFSAISYGRPVAAAWAAWRWSSTRDTLKCPPLGKLAREKGNPRRMLPYWDGETLRLRSLNLLKFVKPAARLQWVHIGRGAFYLAFAMYIIRPLITAYGIFVMQSRDNQDDMLTAVRKDVHQLRQERFKKQMEQSATGKGNAGGVGAQRRPVGRPRPNPVGGEASGAEQGRGDAGDIWAKRRKVNDTPGPGGSEPDDASPTGGMGMYDFGVGNENDESASSATRVTTGDGTQRSRQVEEVKGRSEQRQGKVDGRLERERERRSQPQSSNGNGEMKDTSDPGDDVWEQLRHGASSGNSPSTRSRGDKGKRRQQSQSENDSFSISAADEERSYAKNEAQKAFDDRLERERRGSDFDDNSGKRW